MRIEDIQDKIGEPEIKKKKKIPVKKIFYLTGLFGIFFAVGFISGIFVLNNIVNEEDRGNILSLQNTDEEELPTRDDEPIRSPLNGILISESEYERLSEHIPHAVMISNNDSARDEQYGLSLADIVYEAETEAGITRFMAIFWSNQDDYIMKPVRSVRKYFLDWAVEYDNIPVTFSGFAESSDPRTNAWGFYKEENIRVTYFDWPLLWDDECLATHPTMHCKRTTPELLYTLFEKHEWTFKSWNGFRNKGEWLFDDQDIHSSDYENVTEFQYDFTNHTDWSSRWKYKKVKNVYEKYEPDEPHIDMQTKKVIEADTVVILMIKRSYTGDEKGRVAYETVGTGDAYVMRDGKKIEGIWEKTCARCRTRFYEASKSNEKGEEIPLNPGLIWIAAVPDDHEVTWGPATD